VNDENDQLARVKRAEIERETRLQLLIERFLSRANSARKAAQNRLFFSSYHV